MPSNLLTTLFGNVGGSDSVIFASHMTQIESHHDASYRNIMEGLDNDEAINIGSFTVNSDAKAGVSDVPGDRVVIPTDGTYLVNVSYYAETQQTGSGDEQTGMFCHIVHVTNGGATGDDFTVVGQEASHGYAPGGHDFLEQMSTSAQAIVVLNKGDEVQGEVYTYREIDDDLDINGYISVLRLSAGVDGATGVPGASGAIGPAGAQGDAGPTGAKGDDGETGDQGTMGNTGAKGDEGEQGQKGDTGDTGDDGDDGNDGATGAAGAAGETGPAGAKGDSGRPQGDPGQCTGRPEQTGPTGLTGPTGPAGAKGAKGEPGRHRADMGMAGADGAAGATTFVALD